MASKGYLGTLLNALPSEVKTPIVAAFTYVLDALAFGPVADGKRAGNFQIYWFSGTTHATANQEFSIRHGLNVVPQYVLPILALDAVNSQLVPLGVSRAADAERIYLTSSSTNAAILVGIGVS